MTRRALAFLLVVAALVAAGATAAERRWGLASDGEVRRFAGELDAILRAPPRPPQGSKLAVLPDEVTRRILAEDPDLERAWRSDPETTLALIRRIRDAGGLRN